MLIRRYIAMMIDVFFAYFLVFLPIIFIFSAIGTALSFMISSSVNAQGAVFIQIFVMLGISLGVWLVYKINVASLRKHSATLGYRSMGIKLVNQDSTNLNDRESSKRVLVRMLYVPTIFFVLPGLVNIYLLFKHRGQITVCDLICNTKAVENTRIR